VTLKMVSREQAVVKPHFRGPRWTPENDAKRPPSYEYFGPYSGNVGPDVTDVQMVNRTIGRHSHEVDEFQIMLGCPGATFEDRMVPHLLLHYSDAFALYGPLSGGDEPFHLLQFRATPIDQKAAGAWGDFRLPDDRALMPYVSERHEEAVLDELPPNDSAHGELTVHEMIKTADGVGAWLMIAGPRTKIPVPSPHHSSGQFIYVVDGELTHDGETFGPQSVGWQPPAHGEDIVHTLDAGCRLILMRMPYPPTTVAHAKQAAASDRGVRRT
jgi:hypothetical protein